MDFYRYIILGAGPSGLVYARTLLDNGVSPQDILIIEKEPAVGGLCRSEIVDGAPLDIGGGHFLDTRNQKVVDFLFRFLPREEWNLHARKATIRIHGVEVDHPFESNLWQLPQENQIDYIESIFRAGCVQGTPCPQEFEDWVRWKFGDKISDSYMLPYNRKIWSTDLNTLGTYWLYKLPDVSFRQTLASCLARSAQGTLPAHANFYYPKSYGYGEVWKRIGDSLGASLRTNVEITSIDIANKCINNQWTAKNIITSIPWTHWLNISDIPPVIRGSINRLIHASIDIDYVDSDAGSTAHWIYIPDESITHHRILARSNFAPGAKGYWTETNSKRNINPAGWRHTNEYAYPINSKTKPQDVSEIHQWAHANGIHPIGRWGKWEHMNSDVAVSEAMNEAVNMVCRS